MKTYLIASALCFGMLTHVCAQTAGPSEAVVNGSTPAVKSTTCKLTVVFSSVAKRTGKIYIALSNDKASFSGSAYRKTRFDVPATGEVSVNFSDLPAGTYAVRLYQDLNNNQKLDRVGPFPSEPFGFSNVSRVLFGAPGFEQCAVILTGDKTITIDLIGQ